MPSLGVACLYQPKTRPSKTQGVPPKNPIILKYSGRGFFVRLRWPEFLGIAHQLLSSPCRSTVMTRTISRRDFLKTTAATAGIAGLSPHAYARILGPNDSIHFDIIGLG